jgi:hypothetical protein
MEWEVEFTDDFSHRWDGLTEVEQVDVNAKLILLQKIGQSFLVLMPISFTPLVIRTLKNFGYSIREGRIACSLLLTRAVARFC